MPEYTVVRLSDGKVTCRTTDLAELPGRRELMALYQFGLAVLCEDGVEVTSEHRWELSYAIDDARHQRAMEQRAKEQQTE